MRLPHLLLFGATTLLLVTPAQAEATPYFIGLSQAVRYERNVLGLGNNVAAPAGLERSDTIAVTNLQGGIDQPFGRQRGYANLSLRQVNYSNNSTYNNQAYTGNLGLDWSTIERISGSLSGNLNRSLSSFGSFGLGVEEKNFEDSQGLNATISLGMVTEYSAEAGYSRREVRNSLVNRAVLSRDFDQDTGTVGLRWRPSAATNFGLTLRDTRGRYPKFKQVADGSFQADRFKQQGVELSGGIQPSGLSVFDFRIGQNKTRYDLNQARDFSGVTGSLGWSWQPTGKLRVTTRASRDTGQDSYAVAQFNVPGTSEYTRVNDVLRLQADWDFSAKIAFTGAWQLVQRAVSDRVPAGSATGVTERSGKDRSNVLSFGARWAPYRFLVLSCDTLAEWRSASGELAVPLRNYSVGCSGQLQLQL
jgi:hypothetical protein